jgi:hypothetical protein
LFFKKQPLVYTRPYKSNSKKLLQPQNVKII